MDFALNEDQLELRQAARAWLALGTVPA